MIEMGASHAHVARTLGCSRVSVTNLMQRFRQLDRPPTLQSKIRRTKNPMEDNESTAGEGREQHQEVFAANNVKVLPWPARSPDMSPIEHLTRH
ncbi:hypothetical protein BaRGS_00027888, partial [Batillaria attramentaria]